LEIKIKKLSVFLTILGLLFLITSCETDNLPTNPVKSSSELFENDIEKIEISETDLALLNGYALEKSSGNEQRNAVIDEVLLKYFAMAVAKSLKHPEICKIIKPKAGEKFDGDYDVLWGQIKNTRISGQEMREMVNSRFSDKTRQILTMEMIEEVPLLQVSLPVNFDNWDGESSILVAYTPLTTDDMEWTEIYAYNADLKEYILDAQTEPDFPVIVVGINERVDPKTKNMIYEDINSVLGKVSTTHTDVVLDYVYLVDDGEPWTSGSPEIYCLLANSGGINNRYNMYSEWTGWGTNKSWHHVDLHMIEWHDEYAKTFGISFYEYDGGNTTKTITITYTDKDTGLTISSSFVINKGDDNLGTTSFHKDDAQRMKSNPYTTGSVRFVIDWYEYTI